MILQNNTPTKSKKNISNKTKTNTMDKTTKKLDWQKEMFYITNQKTSKSIQTTKKLKLHHDNFRQGLKYGYLWWNLGVSMYLHSINIIYSLNIDIGVYIFLYSLNKDVEVYIFIYFYGEGHKKIIINLIL